MIYYPYNRPFRERIMLVLRIILCQFVFYSNIFPLYNKKSLKVEKCTEKNFFFLAFAMSLKFVKIAELL